MRERESEPMRRADEQRPDRKPIFRWTRELNPSDSNDPVTWGPTSGEAKTIRRNQKRFWLPE